METLVPGLAGPFGWPIGHVVGPISLVAGYNKPEMHALVTDLVLFRVVVDLNMFD